MRAYWERQEIIRAKRRQYRKRVLPLDWGLNHLGLNELNSGDSLNALKKYTKNALAHSDQYFKLPDTLPTVRLKKKLLSFDSVYPTIEDPINNTVRGYIAEARNSKKAVISLPHWGSDGITYDRICEVFKLFKLTAVRVSLPYHDQRKPKYMPGSEGIFSSNLGRTIRVMKQSVIDVRCVVAWLSNRGYEEIYIMGTSVGSSVAFITAAHEPLLNKASFYLGGSDLTDIAWTGIGLSHIKKGIEPEVSLTDLRKIWSIVSPISFAKKLANRHIPLRFTNAKYDAVVEPKWTQALLNELDIYKTQYVSSWLPCGHYSFGDFPFYLINLIQAIRFFR